MAKKYCIYNSQYPQPESVTLSEVIEVDELPEAAASTPIYCVSGDNTYWHCEYSYKNLTIPNTSTIAWSKVLKRINVTKREDLPDPADNTAIFYIENEDLFVAYNGVGWDTLDSEVVDIDYGDWSSIATVSRTKIYRIKYNLVTEDGVYPHYYLFRGANVIVPNTNWIQLEPRYADLYDTRDEVANINNNKTLYFTAKLPETIYETWSANFMVQEGPTVITATNDTVQIIAFDLPDSADYNKLYYRAFDNTYWHYEIDPSTLVVPTMEDYVWTKINKLYSALGDAFPTTGSEDDTLYYPLSIDDDSESPSVFTYDNYMVCPSISEIEYADWSTIKTPDNGGLYTINYTSSLGDKHIFTYFAKSKVFIQNGWALLYNTETTITDRNDMRILDLGEDTIYYDSNNKMYGYSASYQEQLEWVIDGSAAYDYDLYALPKSNIETDKIYHLKPEVGNTHWHYLNNTTIGPDEIVGLRGVAYKRKQKKAYTSTCPGDLHTTYVSKLYPTEIDKYYFNGQYVENDSATKKCTYRLLNDFVDYETEQLFNAISTGSRTLYNPKNNSTAKIMYNEFSTNYDGWVELTNYTEPYTQAEYEARAQHDNTKVYKDGTDYYFFCHSGLMIVKQEYLVTVAALPTTGNASSVYYNATNHTYWHYEYSEEKAFADGLIPTIPEYKYTLSNYVAINGLTDLYMKNTVSASDKNTAFVYKTSDHKLRLYRPKSDDHEPIVIEEVTAWPTTWINEEDAIRFKFEDSNHNIGYRCFRGTKQGEGSYNEGYYNYDATTQTLTISMDDPGSWTYFKADGITSTPFDTEAQKAKIVVFEDDLFPTELNYWFQNFTNLTTVTNLNKVHTQLTSTTASMFENCIALTDIDLTSWDVTRLTNASKMFKNCTALTNIDVSTWNTRRLHNVSAMFENCIALTEIDIADWLMSSITDMSNMFSGCAALTEFDTPDWSTETCTSMANMFYGCSALTTVKVSNWKFTNCTTVANMFKDCGKLNELQNESWGTTMATIEDYSGMFQNCNKLLVLTVNNWTTSSATNMAKIFANCRTLKTLALENWDTSNVNNFSEMFMGCQSLTTLTVYTWTVIKGTTFKNMFMNLISMTSINIKRWKLGSGFTKDLEAMFAGDNKVTKIYCGDTWNIDNTIGVETFQGCSALSGTIGYDPNRIGVNMMTPEGYLTRQE